MNGSLESHIGICMSGGVKAIARSPGSLNLFSIKSRGCFGAKACKSAPPAVSFRLTHD